MRALSPASKRSSPAALSGVRPSASCAKRRSLSATSGQRGESGCCCTCGGRSTRRTLHALLRHVSTAYGRAGPEGPYVTPSAEELRKFVACSEPSRGAGRLRGLRGWARSGAARGHREAVRVGASAGEVLPQREADGGCARRQKQCRVDREPREPDETLLQAADEVGRDVVATLKRAGTRRGPRGRSEGSSTLAGGVATGSSFSSRGRASAACTPRSGCRHPTLSVSSRVMSGFITDASHELRMPLSIINVSST
jgi:hypothetical protein